MNKFLKLEDFSLGTNLIKSYESQVIKKSGPHANHKYLRIDGKGNYVYDYDKMSSKDHDEARLHHAQLALQHNKAGHDEQRKVHAELAKKHENLSKEKSKDNKSKEVHKDRIKDLEEQTNKETKEGKRVGEADHEKYNKHKTYIIEDENGKRRTIKSIGEVKVGHDVEDESGKRRIVSRIISKEDNFEKSKSFDILFKGTRFEEKEEVDEIKKSFDILGVDLKKSDNTEELEEKVGADLDNDNEEGESEEHKKKVLNKSQSDKVKEKIGKVMGEYKNGELKSLSGDKVTDRKQAIAIAMSEAGISKSNDYDDDSYEKNKHYFDDKEDEIKKSEELFSLLIKGSTFEEIIND